MSIGHSVWTVLPGLRERRRCRACRSPARTLAPSRYRRTSFASDERGTSATRSPACSARVATSSSHAAARSQVRPVDCSQELGRLRGEPPAAPIARGRAEGLVVAARCGSLGERRHPRSIAATGTRPAIWSALVRSGRPAPVATAATGTQDPALLSYRPGVLCVLGPGRPGRAQVHQGPTAKVSLSGAPQPDHAGRQRSHL